MSCRDGCVKHYSLLLCLFSCQASRNFICTVDNAYKHLKSDLNLNSFLLQGLIHVPFIWFPSPPEEGSTLLLNVFVTPATYSFPALKSLLCNLLRQSMQTEVIILTIAAHPLHASHPFNLIFILLKRKHFRLKHSLSRTVIYERWTIQFTADFNHFPLYCLSPFFSSFFLPLTPNLPHSFGSPLCLIASAPPYNHTGSWLSFGVVYIAVIVRVQYRDWAEHVYSFTGQLCNKSGSGEETIGVGGGMYVHTSTCTHVKTLSLTHNAQT